MCDYIIKHYWDERSSSATLEPEWLGERMENLSKKQQKLKKLYQETLGNAIKYQELTHSKLAQEQIGDFHIRYTYNTKKDPLRKGKPDEVRQVTDITMCITKTKRKKQSGELFMVLAGVAIAVLIIVFLFNTEEEDPDISSQKERIFKTDTKKDTSETLNVYKEHKKDTVFQKVCKHDFLIKKLTKDGDEECLQLYVTARCKGNTNLGIWEYWKKERDPDCIKDKYDTLVLDIIKHKKLSKKFVNFFKGEENGTR